MSPFFRGWRPPGPLRDRTAAAAAGTAAPVNAPPGGRAGRWAGAGAFGGARAGGEGAGLQRVGGHARDPVPGPLRQRRPAPPLQGCAPRPGPGPTAGPSDLGLCRAAVGRAGGKRDGEMDPTMPSGRLCPLAIRPKWLTRNEARGGDREYPARTVGYIP